jgi:hypothetical protein
LRGQWRHEGRGYRDDLMRVFVDVPDATESRQFFQAYKDFQSYKERLKTRFRQLDIWLTTDPIEVL